MERITIYQIVYKHKLTGEEYTYMNIGFPSHEAANHELEKILRMQSNRPYDVEELAQIQPQYHRSFMVGCDWRIVKKTIRKA